MYLAPDALEGDVSTKFGHNIAEFNHRNSASFIGYEQRALYSARNVNYQPEARKNNNYHQVWQRNQNRPCDNYGSNQRNQGRDQRANFNNGQNANNDGF